jgi:hypothetical protein
MGVREKVDEERRRDNRYQESKRGLNAEGSEEERRVRGEE